MSAGLDKHKPTPPADPAQADRDLPPLLTGYRGRLASPSFTPYHRLILLIALANVVFGVLFLLAQPS